MKSVSIITLILAIVASENNQVESSNVCLGHYGDGGDGESLIEPDLGWCCDTCNCKDLSDKAACAVTCEAGQSQCFGHYGQGGDGPYLLDADIEWCCDSCNCKDLSNAATSGSIGAQTSATIASLAATLVLHVLFQ